MKTISSRNLLPVSCGVAAALAMVSLSGAHSQQQHRNMAASGDVKKAIAVLHPTQGNDVRGTVTFTEVRPGIVRVVAEVEGLTPGKHGFHVHEWGDCSAPDATSAGGHFNPYGYPHSASTDPKRHVGDLGNLEAGEDGRARLEMTRSLLDLKGKASIIGRGVIVHAKADDLNTQPTGDAGGRVACGVIGIAKPD